MPLKYHQSITKVSFLLFSAFSEDEKLPRLAVVEFSINDSNNQKLVNDSVVLSSTNNSLIQEEGMIFY